MRSRAYPTPTMNASSNSRSDLIEDTGNGSDSDSNSGEGPGYYQPISTVDYEAFDQSSSDVENRDSSLRFLHLPNGYHNGISALDLNEDLELRISEDEEEKEEERMIEASDSAIWRAFREDENRRNAPLSSENATRIMEAMRGISFGGMDPDWAQSVPEDHWIDQLRSLRQSSSLPSNSVQN